MLMKNAFTIILRCCYQNLLVLFKNVFLSYNTFQFYCNKAPFLDVNLKARFFEEQKRQSLQD